MKTTIGELLMKKHYPVKLNEDINCDYYGNSLKKDTEVVLVDAQYYAHFDKVSMRLYDLSRPNGTTTVLVKKTLQVSKLVKDKKSELYQSYRDYFFSNLHLIVSGAEIYIGSDPEIFAETNKGELIPAFDFLGSKDKPTVSDCSNGQGTNNLYWDGFQAEFETRASHCMGWQGDSLQNGLKGLYKALKASKKNARLSAKTVFDIPEKILKAAAPEHVAFGCNKSLNVYGMEGFTAPGDEVPFRSAGGHIHLGIKNWALSQEQIEVGVKALDAILGVASVSMFANFDDKRRRLMYGLAGEYRLPPHGLEYRTLSNAWLFHPVSANVVFDLARSAFKFGHEGYLKYWQATTKEIVNCINNCDVKKAREILKRNDKMLRSVLAIRYRDQESVNLAMKMIMEGADSVMATPFDIKNNWDLDGKWKTHCDGKNRNLSKSLETFRLNGKI